jgi:hypothetical protein
MLIKAAIIASLFSWAAGGLDEKQGSKKGKPPCGTIMDKQIINFKSFYLDLCLTKIFGLVHNILYF